MWTQELSSKGPVHSHTCARTGVGYGEWTDWEDPSTGFLDVTDHRLSLRSSLKATGRVHTMTQAVVNLPHETAALASTDRYHRHG